jgi:hypothetical protein
VVLAVVIPVLVFSLTFFVLYSALFRAVDGFHLMLASGLVLILAVAVGLALGGVPLGWCLLVVTLAPFVIAVGYETVGYRHVEADIERASRL